MNRIKLFLVAGAMVVCSSATFVLPAGAASVQSGPLTEPQITAQTAVLVDGDSGRILYDKGMHARMYPASLTKIMTGVLAVEHGKSSDIITISQNVFKSVPRDTSNAALSPGEQITQDSALYTMFLASANDSAMAIAEHIGGSTANFVSMMNSEAAEMGTQDTHFANPNGLPDPNNYTSAYDLALISRRALQLPELMNYFGAKTYTLPPTNKRAEAVPFTSLHHMLKPYVTKYSYDGVIAGKTGWETMSGWTIVTIARRNGKTLIASVMRSSNQWTSYSDTIALFNYGYSLDAANLPNLGSCSFATHAAKTDTDMKRWNSPEAYPKALPAMNTEAASPKKNNTAIYITVSVLSVAVILMLPLLLIRRRRLVNRRMRRLMQSKYPVD